MSLKTMVLMISAASLCACTLGPDFKRPAPTSEVQWLPVEGPLAPSQAVTASLGERWWDSFNDPQLSALIQQAVEQNLDLKVAATRLLQSRATLQVVNGNRYPSVDASGEYSRARNSAVGLNDPSFKDGHSAFNLWQTDLQTSWEPDFWGGIRREVEAANASVQVSENARRGVLLSVLSETAADYIRLRATQATLAVIRDNLGVSQHSLKLSQMRFDDGVATHLDIAQASAQVASIEARLPTLEEQQARLINALSLLLGQAPRALQAQLEKAAPVPVSTERLGMGLPSELAQRRPDILQAESALHQATAMIGVAKADFYPRISLSGSVGFQALQLSNLGSWSSHAFAFGPQFTLPIFEGGRLRGMLKLREAQQQQAAIEYQQTVLKAWHDIDDVMVAYNAEQLRRDRLAEAVSQSQVALDTVQHQYVSGAVDFLNVLTVQATLLSNQEQLVDSSASVSLARVNLYKALGGGWQSMLPVATNGQAPHPL